MNHDGLVKVARSSEIHEGRSKKVDVGGEEVALWRVGGKVFAVSTVCAHQHRSTLHTGELNGLTISCPIHGWTYSLETGRTQSGEGRVRVFRVLIDGDDVYVEAPGSSWR